MPTPSPPPPPASPEVSLAEQALAWGGKTPDESRRTGAIDAADDQAERLFAPHYQTVQSPVHRAVWQRRIPCELFASQPAEAAPRVRQTMDAAMALVRDRRDAGRLYDSDGRIAAELLDELGQVGYWGLRVDAAYGGAGAPLRVFAPWLTQMAAVDPTVAGLASVHGCIGAVDPVQTFGTPAQKARLLPDLATGRRLSAFALTEPGAGSDLTALQTRAVRSGDTFLVTGEKLFITNAAPGRTVALVCLVDERPAVLIVDLPQQESPQFQFRRYGLWALKHTVNQGLVFRDYPVPAENLLTPPRGDGLTIAYHGLNHGRIALCANAAGSMRILLARMLPWARYRVTYGQPIVARELVRRRLAELAGLIVACDALTHWCSGLLDAGYRGEMECIVAKIFASEGLKHAAIELFMKTHGGRSFLQGHLLGDNLHDYLAPCIYEGEGEMLSMGLFKALVKDHGKTFFEPLGKAMAAAGIRRPNPLNPGHAWALRRAAAPYLKWRLAQRVRRAVAPALPDMPPELRRHAAYACEELGRLGLEISRTMSKFQLALADRQCRMVELSSRCQTLIVTLVTSLYGSRQEHPALRQAADVACRRLVGQLSGRRSSNADFRAAVELGALLAEGGATALSDATPGDILLRYDETSSED